MVSTTTILIVFIIISQLPQRPECLTLFWVSLTAHKGSLIVICNLSEKRQIHRSLCQMKRNYLITTIYLAIVWSLLFSLIMQYTNSVLIVIVYASKTTIRRCKSSLIHFKEYCWIHTWMMNLLTNISVRNLDKIIMWLLLHCFQSRFISKVNYKLLNYWK